MDGHQIAWTFLDGGGSLALNNAFNKPGEFFRFGWSFFRGSLTLTPVKGAISPEKFRAKPWHLLSRTFARGYFSRCPPPQEALR